MTHPRIEYFWNKTEALPWSGCWVWMGSTISSGYGNFGEDYNTWLVHREAYMLLKGKIPEGLQIDHKCKVRTCWNPDHLEVVTQRENVLRGNSPNAINARKTHCKNGHLLEGDNLYSRKDRPGTRECRVCRIEHSREYNKTYKGY